MSEAPPPAVAEAVVEKRSRPSAVWLIPLVAVLIGAFLVYRTFADRGPTVTLHFEAAEGLEAGKTKVKYKDVEIGLVQTITLADDLSGVVVTAELVKSTEPWLTENTRFWVVRAQVRAGRVSGLGTLFSGAYIGFDPSKEGRSQREWVGLEKPPIVTSDDPGTLFSLRSSAAGSFEVGSPVYFRRIEVGEVASSELDESGEFVEVRVFVRAPHDARVRTSTRFWKASGLDVRLGADGVTVDTESVTALLIGGIAFDEVGFEPVGTAPPAEHVFELYPNRAAAETRTYAIHRRYMAYFAESVEGLEPGAPVLLQGMQIGEVLDVRLEIDPATLAFRAPVLFQIEPERLIDPKLVVTSDAESLQMVKTLIAKGLRARLKSGNLLTGKKQIELVVIDDAEPPEEVAGAPYPVVPTAPTTFDALTASLAGVVAKLDQVPLDQIGNNLNRSLARLSTSLDQLDQSVMPALSAVIGDANALLAPDSAVSTELRGLLLELRQAAKSLRLMADYVERHPESLIRGKEEE